ncbi:Mus7/MMS22 family-domain-containing protein [Lasiosphaeria miniovina]|uniref:Mus7/MMS22 family-domain-containing protein n=1 Tax=Lasiosphaeria miniovina TaxID=1954250 RepID=A0AA40DME5_9PEZI|nr:Mus7/MMS22 family-domain-containing protein [Lasiosphaeria miniovina]KAK0706596.1 Mus7/MMS22 family-domain-containing protein [Lasiosphaeria miniovina]
MKNWRELGEVPDSDDDASDQDFDDEPFDDNVDTLLDEAVDEILEKSLLGNAPDNAPENILDNALDSVELELPVEQPRVQAVDHLSSAAVQKDFDIWSIPSSSPQQTYPLYGPSKGKKITRPKSREPTLSPPLSSPPSDEDDGGDDGNISPSSASNEPREEPRAVPDQSSQAPSEHIFHEDEISTSYVRDPPSVSRAPPPRPLSIFDLSSSPPSRTSPRPSQALPGPPRHRATPGDDEQELSRQVAVRLERSLRPRKPIQQHPYLLENAQYANFMKSHGVKPVKVVLPAQMDKQSAAEEDSQEQEFGADGSQDASRDAPLEDTEESAPLLFDNEPDDQDELALSPLSVSLPKTSPGDRLPRPSSQTTNGNHTDMTSLSGDDEFPSPDRLRLESSTKGPNYLKRQMSKVLSSQKKRQKRLPASSQAFSPPPEIWNLPSSPPQPPTPQLQPQDLGNAPVSPTRRRPEPHRASSPKPLSLDASRINGVDESPISIEDRDDSELSGSDSPSASSSESGSEAIRQNRHRIRGVLPASWLRLDQPKPKAVNRKVGKSPEPSPIKGFRRGVALPRQSSSSHPAAAFEFDESDESEGRLTQTPIRVAKVVRPTPEVVNLGDGDGASDMEDDHIDWMLPGRKRKSGSLNHSSRSKKRRSKAGSSFSPRPVQRLRQSKITQILGRSDHGTPTADLIENQAPSQRGKRDSSSSKRKRGAVTPPLLSILDVLEPRAPNFVKIAARAVRKKKNLGKTSPSRKVISLASRRDNIDALSALQDWKSGKTRPRVAAPSLREPKPPSTTAALQEVSANIAPKPSQPRPRHASSFPQKLVRQSNLRGFVTATGEKPPTTPQTPVASKPARPRRPLARSASWRPAQLETGEGEGSSRRLSSKKRSLDAIYRKSRRFLDASTDNGSEYSIHEDIPTAREPVRQLPSNSAGTKASPKTRNEAATNVKSRFRKKRRPQHIDLEAPQYSRANDPLPADIVSLVVQGPEDRSRDKLQGLGPYGTHYTQHFEVFPLDPGTFFHEGTLIGSGAIRKAVETGLSDRIRQQRLTTSFELDGQTLRWGPWNDTVSSELGILVDWIADKLSPEAAASPAVAGERVTEAADFVLGYILDSLSVQDDAEEKAVISRCLEVFSSFASRFESSDWTTTSEPTKKAYLEVTVRFSVAILAVRSLSLASGSVQNIKVEDLLKRCASMILSRLLEFGVEELRKLYEDLQHFSARERGVRRDKVLTNCWVTLMRVLESAVIPRCSFWDVTHSVMLKPGVASGVDSRIFEQLWQNMFTLLPLCEIDNSGILIPGLRKAASMEGWALPQQLIRRVFQLYKSNPRQPPSFNEYCRALVARCHFLVQQWGWRKCTGIIGTIFDFFGSQNLANFRNEEVYRSPRFLEELNGSPSLSIELDDRCFHIFVKLLGLVIQRLKELGRFNDIKNLVARTLPNHNRQYLKEDIIHQHDLAALRNHHDLLCTLFWAAPPDLRPAVHLIEELVVPGTAHKEACLINIRAWSQLARFVISNDESGATFKPFIAWRNNIFNQVLDQYLSAASDIEQQFRALSGDMPRVSTQVRDNMIAKNKAAAMDVLHVSVKTSLDVLQCATSLEAMVYGLNKTQLQKVFTSLDLHSSCFDWGVLRVALNTVEHYLDRIDQASEENYSSELADNVDSRQVEDAVLLFHDHLIKDFFWMGRTILGLAPKPSSSKQSEQAACTDKVVTLAARIAARFVKDRLIQLSPYFSSGKYGLFSDLPKNLNTLERRYLPLFLAVLVKNDVFDFKDIGTNILGLWVLSIVKPARLLGYENYLAEVLKRHNLPFLENATVGAEMTPDYSSNRDLFACAINHMRKSLREAGSAQSKQLRDEFAKTLQLAMQRMKEDLGLLRSDSAEHGLYIGFVRRLISLIKSHGVGICVVDAFFTQPSLDYSPPMQDPQLHTAGIIAYGVRLGEKDVTAVPQLFHYLYNNFKIALGNDKLGQERVILERAMGDPHIVTFMLQFMIPAMIQASSQINEAWLLLEVYAGALGNLLTRACAPREVSDDDMEHATNILTTILEWFAGAARSSDRSISLQQLHVMNILAAVAKMLQPSLRTYLFSEAQTQDSRLEKAVDSLAELFAEARSYIGSILESESPHDGTTLQSLRAAALLSGLSADSPPGGRNARVQDFANTIAVDVRKNWIVTESRVVLQMAGRAGVVTATQQLSGGHWSEQGSWNVKELLQRLYSQAGQWKLGTERRMKETHGHWGAASGVAVRRVDDDLLF